MRNHILILMLFALTACGGAVETAPNPGDPACFTATPEAGGDVTLCPAGAVIISECDAPAPNPLPHEGDCVEVPLQGGKVWCCVPPPPSDLAGRP